MAAEPSSPAAGVSRRTGYLGAVRCFVLFVLGLGAASAMLTAYAPFPQLGNLWRKYHHVREYGADYSLIYIGSSRVFHEFIPEQFDAALAAEGHAVSSFNFGQDGMWPPESFYMLREILKAPPPKLRWVLIDLMGIKPDVDANGESLRSVYWHDFQHTWLAWRHTFEVDMDGQRTWKEKLRRAWRHAELWMQESTGLGKGQEQLEVVLKLSRKKKPANVEQRGFEPGGKGPLHGEMLETFTRAVERLKTNPPPKTIQPALRDGLESLIADVRAAGAEPIFVVAAGIFAAERFSDWPPAGVRVLRFDDPHRYPELYDPARRYDPHHLDALGAQAFTSRLAEQFADILGKP